MVHGDFKDFPRRMVSDKILRDKPFNVAKNSKYDKYQRGLAFMIDKLIDKKICWNSHRNRIILIVRTNN